MELVYHIKIWMIYTYDSKDYQIGQSPKHFLMIIISTLLKYELHNETIPKR